METYFKFQLKPVESPSFFHNMVLKHLVLNFNHVCVCLCWPIGLMGRVFVNGLGDQGSISGRYTKDSKKMLFDPSLLNTQHYKVQIKGKVKLSKLVLV